MYEQFKNEMLVELAKKGIANEQIMEVIECLDIVSYGYDVRKKETSIVPFNTELPELVKTFLVCKSVEGYSKGTLCNYGRNLQNFFLRLQKTPEKVTANDIRVYLYTYQEERGISNCSLDKIRGCLSSFYKWMHVEGYIDKDPTMAIGKIKYEKKPRKPCTQTDLEYLRMACRTAKERAVLEVLYSTGCRVGELVILKKDDIDWQEKTVHIFGKGKKHRTGFLNAKAEVALKEYLDGRKDGNDWLFVSDKRPHGQMHSAGIQKIIREIAARAGDRVNKKVTPHVLRHTTATRMLENKADLTSIQAVLGHSNINTTMIYAHNTLESVKIDHRKAVV